MTIEVQGSTRVRVDRRVRKTARRVGKQIILDLMGLGWKTAPRIAMDAGRSRDLVSKMLTYARKHGLVERRQTVCEHCGSRLYEYRRLR